VLIEKDATMASAYLNRLSHIMRFMLYETKTEKISFQKELEYIEKYIELQKIRTANANYVNYTVKGTGENLQITPMLFIPFIENAFKHAENRKIDNGIEIHFEVVGGKIIFECNNTCRSNDELLQEYNGLGNELMTKRLQLLYPDKHQLSINRTPTTYKVKLEINCE
jgi:LytS/YehU family sensor histidine kinase